MGSWSSIGLPYSLSESRESAGFESIGDWMSWATFRPTTGFVLLLMITSLAQTWRILGNRF